MADNAIEKLFEEMREAKRKIAECNAEDLRLSEARSANMKVLKNAMDRAELLDVTLNKHIYERTPVVQAKMQAHDESVQADYKVGERGTAKTVTGSISVSRMSASKMLTSRCATPRPASTHL